MNDEFMDVFCVHPQMTQSYNKASECPSNECLEKLPLAMCYVPMQKWGTVYDPDVALERGTLFPDLDFPFLGKEGLPCDEK